MMSWNCISQANNFIGQYTSSPDITHLSESKHNSYTTFKVPGGFKCILRPGCRRNVDRGGNIVYITKLAIQVHKGDEVLRLGE